MPTFFQSKDLDVIPYCKIYSTFKDHTTEGCFAFVLMPASSKRALVSLQTIQFDFNAYGDVLAISFLYSGLTGTIQRMAKKTKEMMDILEYRYKSGDAEYSFDENILRYGSCLNLCTQAYLSNTIDFIGRTYLMEEHFIEEIKIQLLNSEYLAKEFARLRGKRP
ncbi:MAG: hypothetical protein PSV35_01990, partial [bacterium]|nr:hypothetical protein [bacterium]